MKVVLVVMNPPAHAGDARNGFNRWIGKMLWSKKWHPTLVFLPGEFHGQSILAGYSPWGCKKLDTTEHSMQHSTGVSWQVHVVFYWITWAFLKSTYVFKWFSWIWFCFVSSFGFLSPLQPLSLLESSDTSEWRSWAHCVCLPLPPPTSLSLSPQPLRSTPVPPFCLCSRGSWQVRLYRCHYACCQRWKFFQI